MSARYAVSGLLVACLFAASALANEPSTVGTIAAVEKERGRIRVAGPEGPVTVAITPSTKIWLAPDRSGGKPRRGSFADCEVGRSVEILYLDAETRAVAAWLKLGPSPHAEY